jgi:hypothetical protein
MRRSRRIFEMWKLAWCGAWLWPLVAACGGNGGGADALTPPADGGPVPPSVECGAPAGTVLYVDPSGDDTNAGTDGEPWGTLAHAAEEAGPGDTVYLRGTFAERLVPVRSGTDGNFITFAADPSSAGALIDGATLGAVDGGLVHVEGPSWIRLCNLTIRNASEYGVEVGRSDEGDVPAHIALLGLTVERVEEAAIYIEGATDVTIERNHTRDSVSSGIGVWYSARVAVRDNVVVNARNDDARGHEEWISIAGVQDFEVARNELFMEAATFEGHSAIDVKESSYRGTVHHNYIHDFPEGGQIYLDAWEAGLGGSYSLSFVDVYANLLVDARGITLGAEQGGTVENVRVFNNVIVRSSSSGIELSDTGRGDGGDGPRRRIDIFNNTISDCRNHGMSGIYVVTRNAQDVVIRNNVVAYEPDWVVGLITATSSSVVPQLTVDHNLVFGPTECSDDFPDCVEVSGGAANTTADPRFVDAAADDLHLLPDSPAVDRGAEIPGLVDDFDGVSRPQGGGVDIGAFERRP